MKPFKIVNSETSLKLFLAFAKALFEEHHYLTFEWRIGKERSLPQNALLHLWLTKYAAYLLDINEKSVTPGILEGMKKHAKKMFYAETGQKFMIDTAINPWNKKETRLYLTSSADWKTGEMFMFLSWLQQKAANDGLILESIGQYLRLQNAS